MKFETNYTLSKNRNTFFTPDESTMTVPDQSISLKELLNKFTRGMSPAVGMNGQYENDGEDFDDINPLRVPGVDITDIQQLTSEINERLERYESFVKDEKEKKRIDEIRKELEATVTKNQVNEGNPKE